MFSLPPLPPFEGLHPLVVHFPIGILLIAWMPMLIGMIDRKRRNAWLASAAMLLIVGTAACFAATITGDAAEGVVGAMSESVDDALNTHQHSGNRARNLFVAATLIYLVVWAVCNRVPAKQRNKFAISGGMLILITYAIAAQALVHAGHQGGVLVHQHGIRAPLGVSD